MIPRVTVFGLGGTIAMTAPEPGAPAHPALTPHDLLAAVPGLSAADVDIEVVDFRRRPGAGVTFDDLTALSAAIRDAFAAGTGGAVVTQGTDTIEESSYFLDLLHPGPQPVVVTGAMRNPSLAGADGPANLLAAVRTAAAPAARDLGALVVFADEIHAARHVRKTHSASPATFASPNGGALGYVVEGRPVILNRPAGRFTLPPPSTPARVPLHVVTLDDDPSPLAALAAGADGLVVAGFGVGHAPEALIEPLTTLAARVPVVLASRTGSGPVLEAMYGFPGSEKDLLDRGLISAGFLHPYKARVLLRLLLGTGADRTAVASAFAAAGG